MLRYGYLILIFMVISTVKAEIIIDGKLSPGEWDNAVQYNRFLSTDSARDKPEKSTRTYVLPTNDKLFIAFDCDEPEPEKLKVKFNERDGNLWFDDSVEVFLKTALMRQEYYHFIINSNGVVFDQLCRPNAVGVRKDWNASGIRVAAGRRASGYQIEIAIPLKNFYRHGTAWAINLARTSQFPRVEYSSVAGVKGGFHNPESFIRFIPPAYVPTPGLIISDTGERHIGNNHAQLTILNDHNIQEKSELKLSLISPTGKTYVSDSELILEGKDNQIQQVSYSAKEPGEHQMIVEIQKGGNTVFVTNRTINIFPEESVNRSSTVRGNVFIDDNQVLNVKGSKVFPLVFYRAPPAKYAELKKYGFNCAEVTNYRNTFEVFDRVATASEAAEIGFMPHEDYSATRFLRKRMQKVVERYRNHPALWAWYLADEPQNYGISPENAIDLYRVIKTAAPELPVMLLNSEPPLFAPYAPACDIFAVDCYPIPKQPLINVAKYIDAAHKAVDYKKPVWFAVQTYASFKYGGRFPTDDELRCMVYLALVHEVKGMLFFAYTAEEMGGSLPDISPEFYKMTLDIATEIKQLSNALLAPEIPQDFNVKKGKSKLHCRLIGDADNLYLMIVNPHNEAVDAKIEFGQKIIEQKFKNYQVMIVKQPQE